METVEDRTLTASDRCDRCHAQAFFVAVLGAGELYFCRHHFMAFEDSLREKAHHVIDQSDRLNQR